MKTTISVISVSLLAALQTVFLPLNLALVVILLLATSGNVQLVVIPILVASLIISLFSAIGFGVSLVGFSASVLVFLLLRRYLPDRLIIKLTLFIFTLIFWEVMVRTTSAMFSNLI